MEIPAHGQPESDVITEAHAQLLADKLHLHLTQLLMTDTTALPDGEASDIKVAEAWSYDEYRMVENSRRVRVTADYSERLIGEVPPLVTRSSEGQLRIHYSPATVEMLAHELGEPEDLTAEDVAKLYIGLGLIGHYFDSMLSNFAVNDRINVIAERMGDRECIERALTTCANPKIDLDLASDLIFLADIRRISEINRLRFSMGVLYMRPEEGEVQGEGCLAVGDMYETRVRDGIERALVAKFRKVQQASAIFESTGTNEVNALAMASESVGELHIAALVPMDIIEMQELLALIRAD